MMSMKFLIYSAKENSPEIKLKKLTNILPISFTGMPRLYIDLRSEIAIAVAPYV